MGCLDADSVLALIDGGLSSERATEIEIHLDGCAGCRRLVSESAALPEAPTQPPAMPGRLGPYEIRGVVGRGGMGEVYRAYDPRLDRQVAIKVIRPHGRQVRPEDMDWFEREARAAAAISHGSVLAVFDVGRHDGVPYVVTELLDGESLRARIKRGPIAVRDALAWAAEIARGLAAAHDRGIVHRDIKPDNVFITRAGHAKLLDFGVAAMLRAGDREREPAGLVVGTLGYMAPEQVRGEPVDHRADVFALGAVLFELLIGRPAFHRAGGTTRSIEVAEASLQDDPFEGAAVPPAIVGPIVQVVRRCLEKSPDLRFQSARDLAFALELAGAPPVGTGTAPRAPRWPWIAGGLAVVLAAAAGRAAWPARRAPPMAAVVTALPCGPREVIAAREGPGGLYVTVATGDGLLVDGLGALRVMRRTPDGALAGVPHTDGALLAAASPSSLLVLRGLERRDDVIYGRLARIDRDGHDVPIPGELGIVLAAEFMPDGAIAVIRYVGLQFRVEAPIGKLVYQARDTLLNLRISSKGAIAFLQRNPVDTYFITRVVTVGGDRNPMRSGDWSEVTSIAWQGDDLLVAGSRGEQDHGVWRFDRGGREQLVWSAAHAVHLQDITAGGALLVTERQIARYLRARRPGWGRERDLSPSAGSLLVDMTSDGTWVSGVEGADHMRTKHMFVRALDGGEPIALGRGVGGVLSPDARQVLSRSLEPPWRIVVTTLAAPGQPVGSRRDVRELPAGDLGNPFQAAWRTSSSLVLFARDSTGWGLYEQALDGPARRLGDWPGSILQYGVFALSPDGTTLLDLDRQDQPALIDLATLKVTTIGDRSAAAVGWSADGRAVWLSRGPWPVRVVRHALDGGEAPQLTIDAPEPSSFLEELRVAGDGATYAYSYATLREELYRVEVSR